MMWGSDGFGLWGGGMGIGMLLFWVLIIAAIVVLARGLWGRSGADAPRVREKNAMEILRERYARGEIDKSEFEDKRRDLEGPVDKSGASS